ncbi:DUF1801 domain-containing protein [uncultured Dokdonia sp.]|uniref:YdeI/OmpD-associated family protein n=1 Tax=uncultured Dokdonia sp. TaxID=575653 RepID=UPI00260EEA42|nr:DUF1801 domain-containing protein [uncultured Dokdonia sp.]
MNTLEKIEHYFTKSSPWQKGLQQLRTVIKDTELQEDWKWSLPCYTINGRNVVGIANFKNHFGVWFFQGVFLEDKKNLLRNAQDGKTKAMRSLHYESLEEIDPTILKEYLLEAIQNAKDRKEIKPNRSKKKTIIPVELESAFKSYNNEEVYTEHSRSTKAQSLKTAFEALSPSKQREYTEHIGGAKQEATRLRRLEKCIPMILEGKGLNDKYKKC